MLAACSSTLCACRTISSPSGVTVTSLALRSKSLTSSSSSSFLMATDSVGWDTKQASAALPKWRSRATATMYLSSVRVIACVNYAQALRARDAGQHRRLSSFLRRTPARGHPLAIGRNSGLQIFRLGAEPAVDMPLRQGRMFRQHVGRQVARPVEQQRVGGEVGKAQQGRAG